MTQQEYYDRLYAAAYDGTFPAVTTTALTSACTYRSDDGEHACAVGILLSDEQIEELRKGDYMTKPFYCLPDELVAGIIPDGMSAKDIRNLQNAHDTTAIEGGKPIPWQPSTFIRKLNECFFTDIVKKEPV